MIIAWRLTDPFDDETATISLDVKDGNQYGKAKIKGDKSLLNALEGFMLTASGAFGHRIDIENTTAIDLDFALRSSWLDVELTEGEEIVAEYNPGIPEGAVT